MIKLAQRCLARPRLTIGVWLGVTLTLAMAAPKVEERLTQPTFSVEGTESARAAELQRESFGPSLEFAVLLTGPPAELDRQVASLTAALREIPGARALSPDRVVRDADALEPGEEGVLVVAQVARPAEEALEAAELFERFVSEQVAPPIEASITGPATIGRGLDQASLDATRQAELIALPVLMIILLLVFRSPIAAAIPGIFGTAAVISGLGALSTLATFIEIDAFATTFASIMGLALGVDYSLLIVSRFREALASEPTPSSAAASAVAVATAGRTVGFAGALLIAGLLIGVVVLPGGLLISAAIGTLVVTVISVAAAVLVIPSVLVLLGSNVNRWSIGRDPSGTGGPLAAIARSRRVLPAALAAGLLALLAIPALGLATGSPSVDQLPEDAQARQEFERFQDVLGPGWGAPFQITLVADDGAITDGDRLEAIDRLQKEIANDEGVATVVGPGPIRKRTKELREIPGQLPSDGEGVPANDRLDRLDDGLTRATDGVSRLRSALRDAASGAGELERGLGLAAGGGGDLNEGAQAAAAGGSRLSAGAAAAAAGVTRLVAGLDSTLGGAQLLREGAERSQAGASRLAAGLEKVRRKLQPALAGASRLAAGLGRGARGLGRLRKPALTAEEELRTAFDALRRMSIGQIDPQYRRAIEAVARASGAVSGRNPVTGEPVRPGYDGIAAELANGRRDLRRAARGASSLETGLTRLDAGLGELAAGANRLAEGTGRLARGGGELTDGLGRVREGGGDLEAGLGRLKGGVDTLTGALQQIAEGGGQLEGGIGRLGGGAGELSEGLAGGAERTGRLERGLGRADNAVARFRSSQKGLAGSDVFTRGADDFFRSGYTTLAALQSAPAADRERAEFVVNVAEGGNAGRILIIPTQGINDEGTRELADRLSDKAEAIEEPAGVDAAVGGAGGELIDYRDVTISRLALLAALFAIASYLLLVPMLRSLLMPLIAVGLNLLTVAASFGALGLLFEGDAPLGGPGQIAALTLTGIFSVLFALSIDYEVFLLARMREGYARFGSTDAAVTYSVERSGRVITGAAAIMIGVFLSFAITDFSVIRQLGVGLAIAILIDATVVRLVLLPALVRLAGPWAWWLPERLERWLPNLHVEGSAPEAERAR